MGNVTLIVGPGAGQYPSNSSCQPILTSVPCRPVPLQPVQWFNPLPSPDWCCPYSSQSDKRCSTDSQVRHTLHIMAVSDVNISFKRLLLE